MARDPQSTQGDEDSERLGKGIECVSRHADPLPTWGTEVPGARMKLRGRVPKLSPERQQLLKHDYNNTMEVNRMEILAERYGLHRNTIRRYVNDELKFPVRA
jgi:hypothetical protein